MRHRWREKDLTCLDQVANATDSTVDLTPASDAPARAVRDAWLPRLQGQDVPLIWERVTPDDPCNYR